MHYVLYTMHSTLCTMHYAPPSDGGPTVWVAIVGSGGTKGPLPGGPFWDSGRAPQWRVSPRRTRGAGLAHSACASCYDACTARLASGLGL